MRNFSKMTLLIAGLVFGYLMRPMLSPMVDSLLAKLKGGQ